MKGIEDVDWSRYDTGIRLRVQEACRCPIHCAVDGTTRRQVAEGLDYARTVGDAGIFPILIAQLTGPCHAEAGRLEKEHYCLHRDPDTLVYEGDFGAPGHGQSWRCTECGKSWAKVGEDFYDPAEGAHLLSPGDVE